MQALARRAVAICWLAYAAIFSLVFGVGVFNGVVSGATTSTPQVVQTIGNGVGLLAIWALGLHRRFMTLWFWRVFLSLDILVYLGRWMLEPSPPGQYRAITHMAVLLVFVIPYYAGIFVYAFRSRAIWERDL